MIQAALDYIARGFVLHPVQPGTQKCWAGYGSQHSIRGVKHATDFWEKHPEANIGLRPGLSGMVVLDIDPRNGGDETLDKLRSEIGDDWMQGAHVAFTPGGGYHLYFKHNGGQLPKNGLGHGIDIQTGRSSVILPPSIRPDGEYRWLLGHIPGQWNPPMLPGIILERLVTPKFVADTSRLIGDTVHEKITGGNRNNALMRFAGKFIRHFNPGEAFLGAVLHEYNTQYLNPILSREEVDDKVRSAYNNYSLGFSMLPFEWYREWWPGLSLREMRVLTAYYTLAEDAGLMSLTPAEKLICDLTGLQPNHYHEARSLLAQRGAIRVENRGRKSAPKIDLLPRVS
jgi:Bifunctional DNA primase/polymerase, N-terminal